jgi:hypothetical protein
MFVLRKVNIVHRRQRVDTSTKHAWRAGVMTLKAPRERRETARERRSVRNQIVARCRAAWDGSTRSKKVRARFLMLRSWAVDKMSRDWRERDPVQP